MLTRYGLRVTASKLGCHLNLGNPHSAPRLATKLPVQLEMSSSALELPSCHVWKITLLGYIAKISGQRPGNGQPLQDGAVANTSAGQGRQNAYGDGMVGHTPPIT